MNGKHPFDSIIDMESTFEDPEHELFMLSVLLGRFEMAKIFCFNGRVILDVSLLLIFFNLKHSKKHRIQFVPP